ncbi:hypothetical protein [Gillisia sp. Hel_I_86]|uniref:hypothetical protein n=1 Tax=Gillisia sp. Hel_I_86 TaxID=1249981 RepID=UPI0021BD8466|nr:hypothetical protein [Gillisia sp. Hel_I_86]
MKIFVSISMSFLFFFQGIAANMEVCEQIEEISHFIAHYQDHKEDDGYSFFEYLYEDYINDDGKVDNHHPDSDHENVPLHTSHPCCQHFVFFAPFQPISINTVSHGAQNQFNYYAFQLNSRYLESLFQPPKV